MTPTIQSVTIFYSKEFKCSNPQYCLIGRSNWHLPEWPQAVIWEQSCSSDALGRKIIGTTWIMQLLTWTDVLIRFTSMPVKWPLGVIWFYVHIYSYEVLIENGTNLSRQKSRSYITTSGAFWHANHRTQTCFCFQKNLTSIIFCIRSHPLQNLARFIFNQVIELSD